MEYIRIRRIKLFHTQLIKKKEKEVILKLEGKNETYSYNYMIPSIQIY